MGKIHIFRTMTANELKKRSFENASKTQYKTTYHQKSRDQIFRSYMRFKLFKSLRYNKIGNTNISKNMPASKLNLVSFESASNIVLE